MNDKELKAAHNDAKNQRRQDIEQEIECHPDWYMDVSGGDEILWRMDVGGNIHIQIFHRIDREDFNLFIRNAVWDVRGVVCIRYVGKGFAIESVDALALLKIHRDGVAGVVADKIKEVKELPNDPSMCNEMSSLSGDPVTDELPAAFGILHEILESLENGKPVYQGSQLHFDLRGLMMRIEGK